MKKSTIITSLSFAAALFVMGTSTALAEISPDQAKEIALKHAGVNPNEATMLKIEKDFDDGITEYEIEFWKNGTEYDYTINADTGKIIKNKQEMKHRNNAMHNQQNQNQYIGEQKAADIALKHANLTEKQTRRLHCTQKFDDGRQIYDVKFWKEYTEYEYEIDALTGEIIEFEIDEK